MKNTINLKLLLLINFKLMTTKEKFTYSLLLNNEEMKIYPEILEKLKSGEKKLDSYFEEENWKLYLYLDESYLKRLFNNMINKRGSKKLLKTKEVFKIYAKIWVNNKN